MHVHMFPWHKMHRQRLQPRGTIPWSMSTRSSDQALAAWHELFERHARVSGALEHELQAAHGLCVTEFEVLERLAMAGDGCRRMQELAGSVHLSQSALSRLVGRLEKEGLLQRTMCPEDRRGIYAHLTDAGRATYEQARPTHRAVLAETLDA